MYYDDSDGYGCWRNISVTISNGNQYSGYITYTYAENYNTACIYSFTESDGISQYVKTDTRKLVKATVTGGDGRGLVLSSALSVDYDFYLYSYYSGWFSDNPLTIRAGSTSYGRSISSSSIGAAHASDGSYLRDAIVYW